MSKHRDSRFVLVERDGWSDNELYEAATIEELAEFLEAKGGDSNVQRVTE